MALLKEVDTPFGARGYYHRIVRFEYEAASKVLTVCLGIYTSKEARDAGKQPLWHEYVLLTEEALPEDPRALLYPILTSLGSSYLQGAKDE